MPANDPQQSNSPDDDFREGGLPAVPEQLSLREHGDIILNNFRLLLSSCTPESEALKALAESCIEPNLKQMLLGAAEVVIDSGEPVEDIVDSDFEDFDDNPLDDEPKVVVEEQLTPLADYLADYQSVFSERAILMIKAGEASGNLADALCELRELELVLEAADPFPFQSWIPQEVREYCLIMSSMIRYSVPIYDVVTAAAFELGEVVRDLAENVNTSIREGGLMADGFTATFGAQGAVLAQIIRSGEESGDLSNALWQAGLELI